MLSSSWQHCTIDIQVGPHSTAISEGAREKCGQHAAPTVVHVPDVVLVVVRWILSSCQAEALDFGPHADEGADQIALLLFQKLPENGGVVE